MSSMEIAEVAGKNHFDLMRAIRKMEPAWQKVTESNFAFKQRIIDLGNGRKKEAPYYELTKEETLYVATKFNDEARAKLVVRWFELEKGQKPKLQLKGNFGSYSEETLITVRMGELTNQIYITGGVVFAKFAPISSYLGYYSTPTQYLSRLGEGNSMKIPVGKQEQWFINETAFTEWLKLIRTDIHYGAIKSIYKDVFGVIADRDTESPYTHLYTDREMLEIYTQVNKRPVNKGVVTDLLALGRRKGGD